MPYYGDIANPLMIPAVRDIVAITRADPGVITTNIPHGYLSNWWIRLIIPHGFGMTALNKRKFIITVLSPTTFSVPLSTLDLDPFVIPPYGPDTSPKYGTPAQAVPIGEISTTLAGSERNTNERPNPPLILGP